MNPNSQSSEKKEFYQRLILVFATVIATIIIYQVLHSPQVRWATMTTKERIADTSSVDQPELTSALSDSTEIVNADLLLVDSLELSWGAERVNIKQALDNIAGVEGSVNWNISYADAKLKKNPDLFTAFGHAENKEHKKPKTFEITLLVNRQNKKFKVLKAVDNGKTLKGAMITISLALDGGYSQGVSL